MYYQRYISNYSQYVNNTTLSLGNHHEKVYTANTAFSLEKMIALFVNMEKQEKGKPLQ